MIFRYGRQSFRGTVHVTLWEMCHRNKTPASLQKPVSQGGTVVNRSPGTWASAREGYSSVSFKKFHVQAKLPFPVVVSSLSQPKSIEPANYSSGMASSAPQPTPTPVTFYPCVPSPFAPHVPVTCPRPLGLTAVPPRCFLSPAALSAR